MRSVKAAEGSAAARAVPRPRAVASARAAIAARCLSELLDRLPHFNYASDILQVRGIMAAVLWKHSFGG